MAQDPFARWAQPAQPPAQDPFARWATPAPVAPAPTPAPSAGRGFDVGKMIGGVVRSLNPLPAIMAFAAAPEQRRKAAGEAAARGDYAEAVKLAAGANFANVAGEMGIEVLKSQWDQIKKGASRFTEGRYTEAAGHTLAGVLPLVGPAAAHAGEQIAAGDVESGIGEGIGMILGVGGPSAISRLRGVPVVPAVARNPNAAVAEAVEFGRRAGIPVDAATATGNNFVRGAQALTEYTAGGAAVGSRARAGQAEALARVGEDLAARVHPTAITAEQAGQSARGAVRANITRHSDDATAAYDQLRAIEADPANLRTVQVTETGRVPGGGEMPVQTAVEMPLPVDLRGVKDALRPTYEALKRENKLTPFIGGTDNATALNALDRLVGGPDYAPLSVVDSALGELKGFARTDIPELRSVGQGKVAEAVRLLDDAVRQTAASAGPDAVAALQQGRQATIAKYEAAGVLKGLSEDGVKAYRALTAGKDANVQALRDLAKQAPAEIPKIGRAVLEDLLSTATAEGGFTRSASVFNKWQSLGQDTKRLLFKDPAHLRDLDRFFLLAKKMSESPNPSGSALVASQAAGIVHVVTEPVTGIALQLGGGALAKFLHSPRGVRLLTQGLTIPAGHKAAVAAWGSQLAKYAAEQRIPLSGVAPVLAEDGQQRPGSAGSGR